MNAIEFVKEHGINNAKTHLSNMLSVQIDDYIQDYINDLKQIVDAFELVESYGGLVECKRILSRDNFTWCSGGRVYVNPLERAVKIVEQCQ